MMPTLRAHRTRLGAAVALALALGLLALSPLALALLATKRTDWQTLSDVGQAYGGVSALIGGIALVGVVTSLLVQTRQHRLERGALLRERQSRLYDIVRSDPRTYWPLMGGEFSDDIDVRRQLFTIEALQYTALGHETGLFPDENLRQEVFDGFFRFEENRAYWRRAAPYWANSRARSRKARTFVRIANEELKRAETTGRGDRLPPPHSPRKPRPEAAAREFIYGALAASALIASYTLIERYLRRRVG